MIEKAHHIGRILINPDDPENVVVAVTGPLYSIGNSSGIYVTNDGGNTWNKTQSAPQSTGFIDLAMVPGNSSVFRSV